MRSERHATRLNVFTDAAFAFALTLLVVAGGEPPQDLSAIGDIVEQLPGYLGAFAIIAMFWAAHVGWSRRDGEVTPVTIMLTLVLIFLVLIFVYPLRTLAQTGAEFMMGDFSAMEGNTLADARRLFSFYGLGFAGMSAAIAGLYETVRRSDRLDDADRAEITSEVVIWSFIAGCGVVSAIMALMLPSGLTGLSPWTYFLIPFFVLAWNMMSARRKRAAAAQAEADDEN